MLCRDRRHEVRYFEVDPVTTVGVAVATLIARKAMDRASDSAVNFGAGSLGRLVDRIRGLFKDKGDFDAMELLSKAQRSSVADNDVVQLGEFIDRYVDDEAAVSELWNLLEQARAEVVDQRSVQHMESSDGGVQIGNAHQSVIDIDFNTRHSP